MSSTVYVETSIIGYLASRSRKDLVIQARRLLTRSWWTNRQDRYRLVTSQLVIDEPSAGDRQAAAERLRYLEGLPLLELNPGPRA